MIPPVDHQSVEQLKSQVQKLQGELNKVADEQRWPPSRFSGMEHVAYGAALGACGAAVALLANVVLAPLVGKHSLELIRVYLTFPLGTEALALTEAAPHVPVLRATAWFSRSAAACISLPEFCWAYRFMPR